MVKNSEKATVDAFQQLLDAHVPESIHQELFACVTIIAKSRKYEERAAAWLKIYEIAEKDPTLREQKTLLFLTHPTIKPILERAAQIVIKQKSAPTPFKLGVSADDSKIQNLQ